MSTAKIFDMVDTWNDAATTFNAIKMNVTDTASAAASNLMDLQVGGTSRFRVQKNGVVRGTLLGSPTATFGIADGVGMGFYSVNRTSILADDQIACFFGTFRNIMANGRPLCFESAQSGLSDLELYRDAADTLAQRRDTNAQTFRLYNTFTDASNFERGFMRWNSNVFEIGTEAGGTGSKRVLSIIGPSLASSESVSALEISQTWNTSGTPTALKMNVTDTASAAASNLMDLQVGGTSRFRVLKGSATRETEIRLNSSGGECSVFTLGNLLNLGEADASHDVIVPAGRFFRAGVGYGFRIGTGVTSPQLFGGDQEAADTLAQRRGTNAQAFRVYNTFTDASNFERLAIRWDSNIAEIKPEAAGTGTVRVLHISGLPTSNPGPGILWNDGNDVKVGT